MHPLRSSRPSRFHSRLKHSPHTADAAQPSPHPTKTPRACCPATRQHYLPHDPQRRLQPSDVLAPSSPQSLKHRSPCSPMVPHPSQSRSPPTPLGSHPAKSPPAQIARSQKASSPPRESAPSRPSA